MQASDLIALNQVPTNAQELIDFIHTVAGSNNDAITTELGSLETRVESLEQAQAQAAQAKK